MHNKRTSRLALSGMIAALATLLMLLTIVPASEIGLPAVAGALMIPVVIEMGYKAAFSVYGVTGILTLLLVGSWEPKLLFIGFFGYYPILKSLIERLHNRVGEWIIKLVLFNVATVAIYAVLIFLFHLDTAAFSIGGKTAYGLLLAMGNGVFILYDIGLTQLISNYIHRFSPRVRRLFRF